jgi:hypothetical protein
MNIDEERGTEIANLNDYLKNNLFVTIEAEELQRD